MNSLITLLLESILANWESFSKNMLVAYTLLFFCKNIFYKNIEAEILNKSEAEILKRKDIILCVETSVNTIQFYVFNLTV